MEYLMTKQELEKLCRASLPLLEQTGAYIAGELGKVEDAAIEEKSLHSLVSFVDKTAETRLVEGLKDLLPGAGFLTEEKEAPNTEDAALRWIIDPLDGTTNFLHQLPCFAVSVALASSSEVLLGMVYDPNRKDMFYAWKDGGAYCNGHPIRVSQRGALHDSLLATGFPYARVDWLPPHLKTVEYLQQRSRGIRRWGAASMDLAYVASGRFDAYFEYTLNPWDVAAGMLLVSEAGGAVSDFRGRTGDFSGEEVLASNGLLHQELLQLLQEQFYPADSV